MLKNEKEKMRANLLRAISHDLRTPLTTIYGSSSAMVENVKELDKIDAVTKAHIAQDIVENKDNEELLKWR